MPDKQEKLDFFAVIKLANHDEIIGFVTIPQNIEEDEEDCFFISDPLIVKPVTMITSAGMKFSYHLSPWMPHSDDNTFHLNQKDVIVWGDMSPIMFEYYNTYLESEEYSGIRWEPKDPDDKVYTSVDEPPEMTEKRLFLKRCYSKPS